MNCNICGSIIVGQEKHICVIKNENNKKQITERPKKNKKTFQINDLDNTTFDMLDDESYLKKIITKMINEYKKNIEIRKIVESMTLEVFKYVHCNKNYPENHNLFVFDNTSDIFEVKMNGEFMKTNNKQVIYIAMLNVKTHLIKSLTNYMQSNEKDKEIILISKLVQEFIESLTT